MENAIGCFILVGVVLIIAPLVIAIVALVRVNQLHRQVAALSLGANAVAAPPPVVVPPPVPPPVAPVSPPPLVTPPPLPPPVVAQRENHWESIVGVKLFAWIGGLAFFLGVVFFIKYAFDNNLITPAMRIVIGAIVGALLIAAGVFSATRRYRAPAQSLCATGVLVLYGDIYAAHAFYSLVPLVTASLLMCAVTAGALLLATRLDAQSVVWLAALGGYLTPALLWTEHTNATVLFGYVALLNFALAAVATFKRWNYFILLAALATIATEIGWAAEFFGPTSAELGRRVLIFFVAQFLAVAVAREKLKPGDNWSAAATALVAFATLFFCIGAALDQQRYKADFVYPILFLTNAALLGLATARREHVKPDWFAAFIVSIGLGLTWGAQWGWHFSTFESRDPGVGFIWYVAIVLLFSSAPYFCGMQRLWPWSVAAIAGPLQFWFVYHLATLRLPHTPLFFLPLAFAIPASCNAIYLMGRLRVPLASADNRLATQIIAILFFVSLVFPVQFHREWITLGWALEGVALLLAYRWLPNAQLRIVALAVLIAAFVRLSINPAVLEYHKRAPLKIWNWYFYAYGIAALCLFIAGRSFRSPSQRKWERFIPALLYSLGTILLFLLLNLEIADYFSLGPTLTFSFSGDFARDMTYSIAWALFAFVLLLIGIFRRNRVIRIAGIALLFVTLAKLFLHDLDQLSQLYRIAAFLSVAIIAIVASFLYQRFLSPKPARQ